MQRLHTLATGLGFTCPPAEELLQHFVQRLRSISDARTQSLIDGTAPPSQWAVPGSHMLLAAIQQRGIPMILASGTPIQAVQHESHLLGFEPYFGTHIYGPDGFSPKFSKREVLLNAMHEYGIQPHEVLSFGDGYSETVEVKSFGGYAVGLASLQPGQTGVNSMKRELLIELGADAIVPHYEPVLELVAWLFEETS
jgi:phosphoglycolate phosphatase-like HAD superfamily hydrolase